MNIIGGIGNVVGTITGQNTGKKIKGTVILMKSSVLDFNNYGASVIDSFSEFLGQGVSFQLVSAVHADSENALKGKVGKKAYLESWLTTLPTLTAGETAFKVTFNYEDSVGIPGAILVNNNHTNEFFLKSITLDDFPDQGKMSFDCNSWVYPAFRYGYDRIFFLNKSYLPSETPAPLMYYRQQELVTLRGNGTGERKEWDRIYDYAVYNDLGEPEKGSEYVRNTLGGSVEFPYPRRGRTGRAPNKADPTCESRMFSLNSLSVYVPRDERFGHLKMSDFLAHGIIALSHAIIPALKGFLDGSEDWDSMEEIYNLYDGGFKLPPGVMDLIRKNVPFEMLKEFFRVDGGDFLKFPTPHVIKENKIGWNTDEEFGREMLAGVNPVIIKLLTEFPPTSKLDESVHGDQSSKMTDGDIEKGLEGMSMSAALNGNKLFILDHHDKLMPYLTRINSTNSKIYATRTIMFLKDDGTLKPVAIELSLPNPDGPQLGAVSEVYTPAEEGPEATVWKLAKAYVSVNDSGVHQLVSHWLNTHATLEPFVIASNRQLSAVHPVYKLLFPHFRDTMNINALARQALVNAKGILEQHVFFDRYAMEISAVVYKDWVFTDQGLPKDLLNRGVAVEDSTAPHGVRLLIEDYPYAVDGLEIWSAIKSWVEEYIPLYYKTDEAVQKDTELQAWWKEVREVGHGDRKDAPWWPKMQTRKELVDSATTIIWIASALHAAINFGQYPYSGFVASRPTVSRRFMPKKGMPEYAELESDPETAFLKTITAELQTLLGISLIEILSKHASDEVYLGQRDSAIWTAEADTIQAFEQFGKKLSVVEDNILKRNNDPGLKNRVGPVMFPYNLLSPTSDPGMTAKGIPNSISI